MISFEEIEGNEELLDLPEVAKHYDEISYYREMFYFVLHFNTIINLTLKTFINHVEQSVNDIDYSKVYEGNLFPDNHQVFEDSKLYMKMIENTSEIFQHENEMFILIGKVVDLCGQKLF